MSWVKRWLGTVPGVRAIGSRLVRWVGRNRVVQGAARRVVKTAPRWVVPYQVAPGTVLNAPITDLPVAIVIVLGADESALARIVDDVADEQRRTQGFRLVLVADVPALGAARKYRYPAELLISKADWDERSQGGVTWDDYVADKLARICNAYGVTASVIVGPSGLDEQARIMLNSLAKRVPARVDG